MVRTLLVSATARETARLVEGGPRRDLLELARRLGAEVVYRPGGKKRTGIAGRLAGAHVKQAWRAAAARTGESLFADGEHIGLPLALFLGMRRKRRTATVFMLGHYVTRWWKLAAFRVASRLLPHGHVFVHSTVQRERLARVISPRWTVEAIPYQVDTQYWRRDERACKPDRPLILAVGAEGRDYNCLLEAAAGLEADVAIAAGSHWARRAAGVTSLPSNVHYLPNVLGFAELRTLYERAAILAVPLRQVSNQSGVTSILEAMSMALPVVVSANEGQRECVAGPLVDSSGSLSPEATADRGPWLLSGQGRRRNLARPACMSRGDAGAMRAALSRLLADPGLRSEMGQAGRTYAERYFSIERFTAELAARIELHKCPVPVP
jgi:glycosyltransferase involved in cell wall biosynthesis